MNPVEVAQRFVSHVPDNKQKAACDRNNNKAREFAELINGQCPDNRAKEIALTKLEEAAMWANKSINMRREEEVEW